jgi:hypothetical protein
MHHVKYSPRALLNPHIDIVLANGTGERHCGALSVWPVAGGGGQPGLIATALAVVDLLQVGASWPVSVGWSGCWLAEMIL